MLLNTLKKKCSRGYQYLLTSFSFKQKNILKLLAKLSHRKKLNSEKVCFYYYRLGMYYSVIRHPYDGYGWRGNLAKAVSYAAVGKYELAEKYIDLLCNKLKLPRLFLQKLALDISPYMPRTSLSLIEELDEVSVFKLALLISLRELSEAKDLLNELEKQNKTQRDDIEVSLYRLNLESNNAKKLFWLNKVFIKFELEPIQLINAHEPLSVKNITCSLKCVKTEKSLVSILVTTYNSGEFIDTVIESLLMQTYSNIEIIITDDASIDNTREILNKYAELDSRIKLLYLSENVGTFVAKTKGLELVNGSFVTCHDSDDWAHPRKIELQVMPLLQNKQLVCTTSQWIRLSGEGNIYTRKIYPALRLNPASPMFRKDLVLKKAGYWEPVKTGADSEFIERLKIIFGNDAMYQVKKPLTIGFHRRGSLMTDRITGYSSTEGTRKRLDYWESWRNKHISNII